MNCRNAQEKIIDLMASRESGLREELDQHVRGCARCRAFLASQASLSTAVDSHLRLIANEPVPSSLLSGVRARLEQEAAPGQWILGWRFAAVAAAVVLVAAAGIRTRRPDIPGRAPQATAQVALGSPNMNRALTLSPQIQQPASKTSPVAAVRKAGVLAHSSAPEVLVLPEEQQAFRRFVRDISKDRDTAKALVAAVPDSADAPVDIALLTIESVEVKPLKGTDSE
jgi:anti-sigma factor RsiW